MEPEMFLKEYEKIKEQRNRSEQIISSVGTCTNFCPYFEFLERKINDDVSPFEKEILVKKYYRSSAGKELLFPEDIRTPNTLKKCAEYLLAVTITKKSYTFIENRIRAVRIDFEAQEIGNSVQYDNISTEEYAVVLLNILRWYICCIYILHGNIDSYLILEQIRKTSLTLINMYKLEDSNIIDEATGYYILSNLQDPDLFKIYKLPYSKNCSETLVSYQSNNFYTYFRSHPDFMKYCFKLHWDPSFKKSAMNTLIASVNEEVSVEKIDSLLGFNSKPLAESFFYPPGNSINFKVKNTNSKEIQKEERLEYPVQIFLKQGNIDFRIYSDIIQNCIKKRHEVLLPIYKIYSSIIYEFLTKKCKIALATNSIYMDLIQYLLHKKILTYTFYKAITNSYVENFIKRTKQNEIGMFKKSTMLYRELNLNYIKSLIYKRYVILCLKRMLKTSVLVCYDAKIPKLAFLDQFLPDYVKYDDITENLALQYTITVAEMQLDFKINQCVIQYSKINNKTSIIEKIKSARKICKVKLSDLLKNKSKKEALALIAELKASKFNDFDFSNLMEDIVENRSYRDFYVYL